MPLPELKKVQVQEHFTLITEDSIGRLKKLCMSVLSLSGGVESEWKHCSSPLSIEKYLAFEYESVLKKHQPALQQK